MMKKIGCVIVFLIITTINSIVGFINIPNFDKMQSYQFELFTICSILAGFSFTVMGLLAGVLSGELVKKLKNTSIITNKSEIILKSVVWFGIPAGLSVLFFTGIIDWICNLIKIPFIREFIFVSQIGCILIGFIYFFRATKGVYILIQKIYGYNKLEMKEKKDRFREKFEEARERKRKQHM